MNGGNAAVLAPEDSALLDAVRGIRWPARKIVRGGASGAHQARSLRTSSAFSEYRAYRAGDETRRIDWKLLARTNRAYVRLAQDWGLLSTMLLLDASASMAYPAATAAKWRQARQIGLGLAASAHQASDPVGLRVAGGQSGSPLVHLPPRTRRGVVHAFAMVLQRCAPGGSAALAAHLSALRAYPRVVIVSDFLGSDEDNRALLSVAGQFIAQGKEIYVVHVVDASELDPDGVSGRLHDPEAPATERILDPSGRDGYRARFGQWREALARDWTLQGGYYFQASTQESAASVVRRIARAHGPVGV